MRCLNDMEENTPIKDVGFENIYKEVANAVSNVTGTYHAAKAAKGAVHSAVKTKIIIGLIYGAAAVAGIAAAVHLINGEDDAEPTIADSSVTDTTIDTSAENSAMTTTIAIESEADTSSAEESAAESAADSSEAEPEPEEEGWRDAYRELVNGYESLDYHLYSGSALPDLLSYALYDIDQNGVPELMFLANDTGDYFRMKTCTIYSWNGVKAYEVSDFGLSMADLGEFSDKKQFAVTSFDSYSGITAYYSIVAKDGRLVSEKVGEADSNTAESSDTLNKFIGMRKDELINDYFDGEC